MNPHAPSLRSRGAFTLIELLTVIAIIAILMALLFPALNAAKEGARKARAATDVQGIVSAVKSYATEYGKLPETNPADAGASGAADVAVGPVAARITGLPNSVIFNTLRNIPNYPNEEYKQNPRRVNFYEGKAVSNPQNPREGFLDDASGGGDASLLGCLFDPWEEQYAIVMDTSYDNVLSVNTYYSDFTTALPRLTVGAFSMGKDNKLGDKGNGQYKAGSGTKSDDVVSWTQ